MIIIPEPFLSHQLPFARNQLALLHSVQRTIQRAFLDNNCAIGPFCKLGFDSVPVHILCCQQCKNQNFDKTAFDVFLNIVLPSQIINPFQQYYITKY